MDSSVFGYEDNFKYPIYVSKCFVKINMLICYLYVKKKNKQYVLIKYFNRLMYFTLLHDIKYLCNSV